MADPDIPLQQLDPSPIESPADASKEGYFPPHVARSSTLGLGGHSAAYYLTRIQRYSSYTFSVFLAFHITNTSLIPLATGSVSASEPYLLLTRPYYQSTIAEPAIVILPLLLHIGAGTALRLFRRHQLAVRYGSGETSPLLPVHHHHSTSKSNSGHRPHQSTWPLLSGTSKLGYAIIPLVGIHALVNRGLPLWIEGGSSSIGLSFVSHGFAKHPAVAFVGVYDEIYARVPGLAWWS
ncbi:MAG: hypothetical protein M1838_001934 [Thelocarpon superellum]|nr:MAG: hypothetical protein M1838_001934 [Thelocarpon superellum]